MTLLRLLTIDVSKVTFVNFGVQNARRGGWGRGRHSASFVMTLRFLR